jgi:hypothetical protein
MTACVEIEGGLGINPVLRKPRMVISVGSDLGSSGFQDSTLRIVPWYYRILERKYLDKFWKQQPVQDQD